MITILDLFSGMKSWSNPFKENKENNIITVDINPIFEPTYITNILNWDYKNTLKNYTIDIIFSSPPCNFYFTNIKQLTGISIFTEKDFILSKKLVDKTIEIIEYFNPSFYIIENPKGKMRYIYPFIFHKEYKTLSYCMYGASYKKPTDIWTNLNINFKQCNHSIHAESIKENYQAIDRGRIPLDLTILIKNEIYKNL